MAASSSGMKRPLWSSSPTLASSATTSTRPDPHSPRGSTSPMTWSSTPVSRSSLTTSMAPSAARMPQRIAPPSKAGPAGAAVDTIVSPLLSTISQLVPTSMNRRVRLSRSIPVASMPGDDVAADVGAQGGEHRRPRARVEVEPDLLGEYDGRLRRGLHERRHPERLGIDPEGEGGHRRVAGDRDLVDVRRIDTALDADLLRELVERLARERLQPAERLGIHHRGADPGDHVATERLLLVEPRGDGDGCAGAEVEQGRDDRGGAEVEGDRVAAVGGVARARRR